MLYKDPIRLYKTADIVATSGEQKQYVGTSSNLGKLNLVIWKHTNGELTVEVFPEPIPESALTSWKDSGLQLLPLASGEGKPQKLVKAEGQPDSGKPYTLREYQPEDWKDPGKFLQDKKCAVCGHHLPVDQMMEINGKFVHSDFQICLALQSS
jgi:hypothetical protein